MEKADSSGHQLVSLDSQNRICISVRFRHVLSPDGKTPFRISPGIEEKNKYLVLYPDSVWQGVSNQIRQFRNFKEDTGAERKLMKHFFGNTHTGEIDGNGRVLLPNELKIYAQLDKRVSLVGMKDWVEIWNEDMWRKSFQHDELVSLMAAGAKQGIRLY